MSAQIDTFKNSKTPVIELAAYREKAAQKQAKAKIHVQEQPQETTEPWVIQDNAHIHCQFNIMEGRNVREDFFVKEYRIHDLYGEATFDRTYFSSMDKSPDHLILFTAQAHTQKMIYLILTKYFGYDYDAKAKEHLKVWPTHVSVEMPRMVRDNTDVIQKMWINSIAEEKPGIFQISVRTTYNDIVAVNVEAKIYLIK